MFSVQRTSTAIDDIPFCGLLPLLLQNYFNVNTSPGAKTYMNNKDSFLCANFHRVEVCKLYVDWFRFHTQYLELFTAMSSVIDR